MVNGIDILILHYLNNKPESYELKQAFWKETYSANPIKSTMKLVEQDYIKKEYVIENSLRQLKVVDLKEILSNNRLSVSGKKQELIDRVISFVKPESYKNLLEKVWTPTDKGKEVIERTDFIIYIHKNLKNRINIIDVYDYYLSHENLSSKEVLIQYMKKIIQFDYKYNVSIFPHGIYVDLWEVSKIYRHYDDSYGQFTNLMKSCVSKFIDFYENDDLYPHYYLEDFDRFIYGYGVPFVEDLKLSLAVNEEFVELLKSTINDAFEEFERKSIFTSDDIYEIINAELQKDGAKSLLVYKNVFKKNGGKTPKENPEYDGDEDGVLATLFMDEPHLESLGDSVVSTEKCIKCGEKSVYNGPEIELIEIGRCMICGTMNKVN